MSYFFGRFGDDEGFSPPPLVTVEQAYPPQPIPMDTSVPTQTGQQQGTPQVQSAPTGSSVNWTGLTTGILGSLVGALTGRPYGQQPVPPGYIAMTQPEPTPLWVYLAIPVALVGVVAYMRRKPSATAGYRRRRSRR